MLSKVQYAQMSLVICSFLFVMFMLFRNAQVFNSHKFFVLNNHDNKCVQSPEVKIEPEFDRLVFGDNITGFPDTIVPNIVHNVLFGIKELKFSHFISMMSVLRNQKPEIIYIHCDCAELTGPYYNRVLVKARAVNTKIIVRNITKPKEVFGIPLSKDYWNWHASDITRIRALIEFGGIYLDNDVYVVQSLDVFRKFEMTINWDEGLYLGNQVIIGHKNARFLRLWLESYHSYDASKWYYNAGDLPTLSILYPHPELVHRVKGEFGVNAPVVCPKIYSYYYPMWRKEFYTVHLVMRGNDITFPDWCFGDQKPAIMTFNENNVMEMHNTFGEMCREVMH